MDIRITDTPFEPGTELNAFSTANPQAGAIASFLGQVRDEDGAVNTLSLEIYPGVTEKGIQARAKQAMQQFRLSNLCIIHRHGDMSVGEPIVLVLTAAKHRRDAFLACDYLMDYLKTEAIFWKKQTGQDGTQWIEPRPDDYQDAKRWRP